ncbi:MAG: DUF2723 domain-containing protein [Bacteroidetes bacterium]|nr:DUF2723 domain-containing protein [Bacteroidota bacterium]
MNSFNFSKWNTLFGWATFAIALLTYTLTLEPTVSYWDCGEYISTAVKLEVGHPPGAPLFQMLGAFFAMFTTDVAEIAKMVNFMSALASAFTILFMFWTITALGKKLVEKSYELTSSSYIAILGSGVVGALTYTFSDSFWFSAVEAEVYAMSSFLMALLFWLGIRWEAEMDKPQGNKWLLLISFVVGLSFGVHILSLLVIPSIVFLYIYKKYKNLNTKQFVVANIVSILVLMFVFKMLFPYTLRYFSALELFFVNSIGLPFNSGSIIAAVLLVALFYFGIKYTHKKQLVDANTVILSVLFIMIGFSSWLMLPIRANANTTINENNPSSARELLAYYDREQYGDANVFYDTYYSLVYNRDTDNTNPTRDDKPKYEKDFKTNKYVIVNHYKDALPNWSSKHKGVIPRMVSTDANVIKNYKAIAGIPQNSKRRPTFIENIKYMVDFQFGYMYGRYFMWNFVGRQNDEQGQLDIQNGNWLSGIDFIDEMRLGPQSNLPSDVENNKGRNKYYFLPFILGMIGLYFHFKKDKNDFYVLFLFFAFTGLAIIFYTNPKPFEPRERDYAIVGSFYIFAIWVGFGVLALFEKLKEFANPKTVAIAVSVVSLLAVPTIMASENWDDHDRSNRYTSHLNAKAYLDSCDPNAILFTIGDNDTFPLWYMQEVEDYRTDMKLINTSLFATDWYIDQMKRKTYEADPIPSQLTHDKYKWGTLDVAYFFEEVQEMNFPQLKDSVVDIEFFMKWIESENDITYFDLDDDGIKEKILPSNKIRIPVDKEAVLRNGIVAQKDSALIVPYIDIEIGSSLTKNRILMLDILANNHWEKPIYFTGGAQADEEYIWLKDYLQLDGMTFKLVPIYTPNQSNFFEMGRINSDIMYKNVMNWDWRNITDDNIYLDPETRKNSVTYRNNMERLARILISEGQVEKAKEILDISLEKMPVNKFGHYSMLISYIDLYYLLNENEKARTLVSELSTVFQENLTYYSQFSENDIEGIFNEIERSLLMYDQVVKTATQFDSEDYSNSLKDEYISYLKLFDFLIKE